jgi:hypothetical protein
LDLTTDNFVGLKFTTQRNRVKGEKAGLGASGDPSFCTLHVLAYQLIYPPLPSPCASHHIYVPYFFHANTWNPVCSINITKCLHQTTVPLGPPLLHQLANLQQHPLHHQHQIYSSSLCIISFQTHAAAYALSAAKMQQQTLLHQMLNSQQQPLHHQPLNSQHCIIS